MTDDMFAPEPLHPDLQAFIHKTDNYFGADNFDVLQHPLVYEVPYAQTLNKHCNRLYEHKKRMLEIYMKEEKYEAYVYMYERPWRLYGFEHVRRKLLERPYWELLADLWEDSENIWENQDSWISLLSAGGNKRFFMNVHERKTLRNLPKTVIAYRGHHRNPNGLSWTLDKSVAEFFANRFRKDGIIERRVIKKHEIFAYKNGRKEKEIILLPK